MNQFVTDEQRNRRAIFIETLRVTIRWMVVRAVRSVDTGVRNARRWYAEKRASGSGGPYDFMRGFVSALRNAEVAKWISIAGHPFIFSPIVALLVGASLFGPVESVVGLLTVILCCLLPVSLYILWKVRIGAWSDLDVSARKDRPRLFLIGFAFLLLTVLVLTVTSQPIVYARGCFAAMILIVGGWFLNRWLKPSMHAGFAMLTACSLWPVNAWLSLVAIPFALAVGWSRVQLRRHTWSEVGVGLLLGMLVCRLILA
ncbi:MAG: phosphatase PAP2 family protein [Verrucomicrobia bacterium]|nr:phosphatase PAP2 family protein [Verrucomicrobiota bacterium]